MSFLQSAENKGKRWRSKSLPSVLEAGDVRGVVVFPFMSTGTVRRT